MGLLNDMEVLSENINELWYEVRALRFDLSVLTSGLKEDLPPAVQKANIEIRLRIDRIVQLTDKIQD